MAVTLNGGPDQDTSGQTLTDDRAHIIDPTGTGVTEALLVVRTEQPTTIAPIAPQKPWGPLLLALYNVLLGASIAYVLASLIMHWPTTLAAQASAATAAIQAEATVRFLVLTSLGAGFGAVIHNLLGLHIHVAVVGDFQARFSGSYVLGPIAAMGLGFALFVILQGGLMALGGDTVKPDDSLRPALFYIAIGILTGLAWDVIVLKFDTIARQLFGGEGHSRVRHALDRVRKPGEPA